MGPQGLGYKKETAMDLDKIDSPATFSATENNLSPRRLPNRKDRFVTKPNYGGDAKRASRQEFGGDRTCPIHSPNPYPLPLPLSFFFLAGLAGGAFFLGGTGFAGCAFGFFLGIGAYQEASNLAPERVTY